MCSRRSAASVDSTSDSSGQGCESSLSASAIRGGDECSDDIGRKSPSTTTYEPSRPRNWRLTEQQKQQATARYEAGESCGILAIDYGVTRQSMWDMLRRRTTMRDRLEALPREHDRTKLQAKRKAALERYRSRAARITAAQVRKVRARDRVCVECGEPGTDIDHIVPVRAGGQTTLGNLQLLCKPCHVEKSRTDWEAYPRGVTPSEATRGSTSSAVASRSRARTLALPEDAQGSQANAPDCSSSSLASQMSFAHAGSSLRTSLGCSPLPTDGTSGSFSQRWATSGMAWRGGFSTLDSSECPSGAVECSLSDILVVSPSRRYELSARAASGILRRAAARGRALPAELEAALQDLSRSDTARASTAPLTTERLS